LITINNLDVGATWQYSISGDNGFVDGTGNNYTLADNATYAANAIQVGICPFYVISNIFIYGATTTKVGCLSIINSSCMALLTAQAIILR
jgi:hypothetical protein